LSRSWKPGEGVEELERQNEAVRKWLKDKEEVG
jgi:hypothetical protein